jgi:excisionase family DNA binding protein
MARRVVRAWRSVWAAVAFCCVLTVTTGAAAQNPEPCPAVLTIDQAAALLRVDPGELERLAEQGAVPGRRVGSVWRFGCVALLAWLNGGEEQDPPCPSRQRV